MRRSGHKGLTVGRMKGARLNELANITRSTKSEKPETGFKIESAVSRIPTALPHPHKNLGTYLHPKKSKKR